MEYKLIEGIQLIKMEGSVLQSDSGRLDRYFSQIFSSDSKNVVIDLTDANHISSSVLGQIVFLKNKLKALSGDIRLVITDDDLLELFDLTMLNKVFEIYPNVDAAFDSYLR
jgi:anti-sigma B factor antagonist